MIRILLASCMALFLTACGKAVDTPEKPLDPTLSSADGDIEVRVGLDAQGQAEYQINHRDEAVLLASDLGMAFEDRQFTSGLELESVSEVVPVEDRYTLVQGKQREVSYSAREKSFRFINGQGQKMDLVFQVSSDGVAFRYEFPGESAEPIKVIDEITSFKFPEQSLAWLQPMQVAKTGWMNTNPAYEEHYHHEISVGTSSPVSAGWVFPGLFNTGEQWVLITEAGMDGSYHGSRLRPHSPEGEYRIGFPDPRETFLSGPASAEIQLPFSSPWRIIAVGDLDTVVESHLGTALAAPEVDMDMSFVDPGMVSWSWALLKEASIFYDTQKEFIDYAADMGWNYTLIDADWDRNIGYEKTRELAEYAQERGVGVMVWYNSSGPWNQTELTPKDMLLTRDQRRAEFARLQEMGIKGVKIDFFPGDGQSVIQYYIDILEDAADFELMVNFHGATLPRGLHRTYPNFMTSEAVHGFEMLTFFQESMDREASHAATLVYARNVYDPMDFTPTVFGEVPGIERKSTNGFQLALPVLFLSGLEHIAETPEGMSEVPDYVREFMRELPVVWDESKFVEGYPGKLAVFARRKGETWYVAGINGEQSEKALELDLGFVGDKDGVLITDGEQPREFERRAVKAGEVSVTLKPAGGFVIVFR